MPASNSASDFITSAPSVRGSAGVGVKLNSMIGHDLIVFPDRSTKCETLPLDQPSTPFSASAMM
ncbi:MAG: hypothetical protein BWY95_02803 [Bacteroidetes bacterium ADurb.BinA104]|nr:MAG: hypothetical protein BWY95_02803 [Bacteroidetes bacterium ADurb.BinA104]